jgi:hypothetical protein
VSFCDAGVVLDFFKGKSVAIVGGSPNALDNKVGFIDSHDIVVRVNNYKLFPQTGHRTDVFYSYFGGAIKKTVKELMLDGVKLCMAKCPNTQFIKSEWHFRNNKMNGVDFRYIYRMRDGWWFCDTYVAKVDEFLAVFNMLDKHIPTTGFNAIYDVLKYKPKSVYITGFDFFESGFHNVNERWAKMNPKDPIGHRPDLEKAWLKNNINKYPIILDKHLQKVLNA